ncbi:hypothetical protein RIF29_34108 [Crotalaria pallida]|uniref:Uncharacterized protein n=1 Tax=Crotalaria pallida TaxID=3830 RepID=A0AAN9E8W6_CROPI
MEELTQKTNAGVNTGQADNKIQEGLIPEENLESASQAVRQVLQDQGEAEEAVSTVKETQLTSGNENVEVRIVKDQNEGQWTPVQTRRKAQSKTYEESGENQAIYD